MRFSWTAVLGASVFLRGVAARNVYSAFTQSSWNAHTTISFPNSTAFIDATERWNSFDEPTYSLAITPATEEDVAQAVKIARSINFPFLGTGGRHSSAITLGNLQRGLAIDLSALDSVSVNAEAGTLTIGGGTTFGQILTPVYEAGYQIPVGSCACPGMVGATIGGGVGRYQGINGLIIDNMLSVRLVTAEGKLIDVSETSNPDLWWAVRGAGANFGIITSATYKLTPLVNDGQVLKADFVFPASSNASYFSLIEPLNENMPAELSAITIIEYNATAGEAQLLVSWAYIGPEDEGRKLIAPLLDLNPVVEAISMVSYNNLTNEALFGLGVSICADVSVKGYGVNYRNLSASTYEKLFQRMSDFYLEYPDGQGSSIELETFSPAAVELVAADATSYPWRDTKGYAGISFSWNSTKTEKAGDALALQVRSDLVETSGYDGLAVYVSYAHGDESLEEMWGINVPRLKKLKSKWDPDNVFRFFHSLATNGTF
jgi:hypothetical protein